MTWETGMPQASNDACREISPVKRALLEIRRLREEVDGIRQDQSTPIAIVGMALRLPGGIVSPEALWQALLEGKDLISLVPKDRWQAALYRSPNTDQPGTMRSSRGGFLLDVDCFDAEFFGIAAREAASMDPQHRLLLELAWEALERAGIDPQSLFDTQAGVFLGLSNSDYSRLLVEHGEAIDGYTGVGAAMSMAAGRLAYFFGCHGPAMVFDTACSSSLVAIHHAVASLRRGETGLALVGGANLVLSPEMNLSFSRTGMLSAEGRCQVFSAAADGYVRSEGCCVMVLKRLADAERDGDKVLAMIHGSAVNQDGRSAGITAPNGPAQAAVMRGALKDARLDASAVSYVEAHGTGTPLGDPMEVQALASVYGAAHGRADGSRLQVGSVKSNLGHTEAAAGLVSLAKVVLMMQPGNGFVRNLHIGELNPRLDWNTLPIEIVTETKPWERLEGRVNAGISSFGFSGTNAHLIVGSTPEVVAATDTSAEAGGEESILFFSAAHGESLKTLARGYVQFLERSDIAFEDVCANALACRARLGKRIAVRASSSMEAAESLRSWLGSGTWPEVVTNLEVASADEATMRPHAADALRLRQWVLVFGDAPARVRPKRRVDVPLYAFRRTRFWFGAGAEAKLEQQRERAWQAMTGAANQESLRGPLGWSVDGYSARWGTLERLTRANAQHVLASCGAFDSPGEWITVEEVIARCGFRPIYADLIRRWLVSLAAAGVLERSGEGYRAVGDFVVPSLDLVWLKTAEAMADDPTALDYLKRCGALLADVLCGRKLALETLFPDGSFEMARRLYKQSVEARYFNPIVAATVAAGLQKMQGSRPLRVLEIGAGTGATTSAVLESLGDIRLEYWFTDVSDSFINHAKKQFEGRCEVQYALFDLERDPEEQGFPQAAFDLVLAANAVHAVRDLDHALGAIQRLLAPGAALVLLETTHHHACFDMSTGLIEGWQSFDDAYRRDHPLLDSGQWEAVLTANGFATVAAYPDAESRAAALGQNVLLARSAFDDTGVESDRAVVTRAAITAPKERAVIEVAEGKLASPGEFGLAVRETICSVFQLAQSPAELGDRDRLSDLGMDSLIALELRAALARRLEIAATIPSTIAYETGTVGELVRALEALRSATISEAADSPASSTVITATQLESMTEEQVEQLLEERLGRL